MVDDATTHDYEHLIDHVSKFVTPRGLETYPFKIGWYNDVVSQLFRLPYSDDTLAFIVLSTPDMFQKSFLPFIRNQKMLDHIRDPIDNCMIEEFQHVKKKFCNYNIDSIHDFELTPTRRPKILVQTAGHVAGAVFHYKRTHVEDDPWGEKKIFGVSIHPRFGGWFGFRGVLIFSDIIHPGLKQSHPPDIVPDRQKRIELLEKFNFCWRDWSYRDVIEVESQYSELQKSYFDLKPKERRKLIEKWMEEEELVTEMQLSSVSDCS